MCMMTWAKIISILKLFIALCLIAFVLNWIWEMVQMPSFVEMAGRSWWSTVVRCTIATVGDVGVTLTAYILVALATGKLQWAKERNWNTYAVSALLGVYHAILTERWALASGSWSYTEAMPRVPILDVGLWPFLQLGVLIPIAILLTGLILRRFD